AHASVRAGSLSQRPHDLAARRPVFDRMPEGRAHQSRRPRPGPHRRRGRAVGQCHVALMQLVLRKEGKDKVTAKAIYVDDPAMPGMLLGGTIRPPCARGRIRGLTFAPHIPWDEFVVITAKDIPGHNAVALITNDQPYLAEDVFEHAEEPVALLAHAD